VFDLLPAIVALPLATLLPHSIGPYIALMLSGFAIGILGHLSSSKALVTAGIVLIALGAFLFPLALTLTAETPPNVERGPSP
jgi:hypothetical protein